MDKVSQNTPQVNPLAAIVTEANAAGRHIARTTVFENERGKLMIRADQRGYLLAEVWKRNEGPTHRLTLGHWDAMQSTWIQAASLTRAHEWMAEAAEILGEQVFPSEELPSPLHPVDQITADIVAIYGGDFDGRLQRAAEMVKQGTLDLARHETTYHPEGQGFWSCQCADAKHRSPRWQHGTACKHGLGGFIQMTLESQTRQAGQRRLIDRIEARRQRETALPVGVSAKGRMTDYLG
jgi:hypothetical protein